MKKLATLLFAMAACATLALPAFAVSTTIVVSQLYGGGGNTSAPYRNDFIELYNRGSVAVNVTGWAVQYASSTSGTWVATALTGTIPAGRYLLVQESSGGAVGVLLPTPDVTGTIVMAAGAGKVALTNTSAVLAGTCPAGGAIVDFVGYGTGTNCFETAVTGNPSNTQAVVRKSSFTNKNIDTDNNAADFIVNPPCPRNSTVVQDPCGPTPAASSTWGAVKTIYR